MEFDRKHIAILILVLALLGGGVYGAYAYMNADPAPTAPPADDGKDAGDTGSKSGAGDNANTDPGAKTTASGTGGATVTHLNAKGLKVWDVVPAGVNTLDGLPKEVRDAHVPATPGQKAVPEEACTKQASGLRGDRTRYDVYYTPLCGAGNNPAYMGSGRFKCRSMGGLAWSDCFQYTKSGRVVKP